MAKEKKEKKELEEAGQRLAILEREQIVGLLDSYQFLSSTNLL